MSSPELKTDKSLVDAALQLVAGFDDGPAAQAIGVSVTTLAAWRGGARPKLKGPTRRLLTGLLPGKRVVMERPIARAFERVQSTDYAAGVLWSIEEDARHIAEKARKARERLLSRPADPSAAKEVHEVRRRGAQKGAAKEG